MKKIIVASLLIIILIGGFMGYKAYKQYKETGTRFDQSDDASLDNDFDSKSLDLMTHSDTTARSDLSTQ